MTYRSQSSLPNPPAVYDDQYMFDLASLSVDTDRRALKHDQDNVIEEGSLILKSSNGKYWRINVGDTGTLSTTEVPKDSNEVPITASNPYT